MVSINQNYAFPHVKASERIVGPLPVTTGYRNTIGIAGQFRRGPKSPTSISNLQDAVYLYGSDNSPGSLVLRQAFLQGATNMVISRAVPEATRSKAIISFSNLLPTNEAQVGYTGSILQYNEGEQVSTTGLRLDVNYCGQAIETVQAAGVLTTKENSSFTERVDFNGLGYFDITAEDYLETRGGVTVAQNLLNTSAALVASGPLTFADGAVNQPLMNLSLVSGGPYAALANIPDDTIFRFNGTAAIKIKTGGTEYDVVQAGSILANEVALEEKQLRITSLNTRLEKGSYLYFPSSTFKSSEVAEASNNPLYIKGYVFSANPNNLIAAGTDPEIQAKITESGVVKVVKSPSLLEEADIEQSVQLIRIDRTLPQNQALVANLKPGRILYSIDPDVEFNPTTNNPVVVLSSPKVSLDSTVEVEVLVKGYISDSKTATKVALYDTKENSYIFSSTFRVARGFSIFYKKNQAVRVQKAANASGLPPAPSGSVYVTLAQPIAHDLHEGHLIVWSDSQFYQNDVSAPRFRVSQFTPAGSVSLLGTMVVGSYSDVLVGEQGYLYDPFEYERIENAYEVESRQSIVDSFIVSKEASVSNNFEHLIFFKRSDGSVISINSGIVVDLGEIGNSGKIAYLTGGTFRLPVARGFAAIGTMAGDLPFEKGTLASELAKQLAAEISLNNTMLGMIDVPVVGTSLNPVTMELVSAFSGQDSNRIKYFLSREATGESPGVTADDIIFNATNAIDSSNNYGTPFSLSGAVNGSSPATIDFYSADSDALVRVRALSDGVYGNKISVSITPGSQGQFTLTVIDNDSSEYLDSATIESMILSTRDVDNTGLFNASANSRLVRVFYLPAVEGRYNSLTETELNKVPMRIAPSYGDRIPILNSSPDGRISSNLPKYARSYQGANYLQNIYLEGGENGIVSSSNTNTVAEESLVRAVRGLESQDCSIIVAAGVTAGDGRYSRVIEELSSQVNRASTMTGIRTALVQAPPNLSVAQAQSIVATLNNPRIVLVGGHITMAGVPGYNNVGCVGAYAGLLATNPPETSPAAAGEGMVPQGVISCDTPATPLYLDQITRARTEVMFYDSGLKIFKFLNGRSTTANTQDHYISVRRMADQILQDLYTNLVWVRSNQNTPRLRSIVQSSVDAYFQTLTREGRIAGFRPSVCNGSNNTPSTIAQGQLNINISWTPNYPADFINVSLTREIVDSLSIQIG